MKFSNDGIALLKQLEGCVKQNNKHIIYDDKTSAPVPVNLPLPHGATIGYGHLVKPDEDFSHGITESVATELLRADITTAERAVQNNIVIPLTQNQFDALVIFAYNIGAHNFANSTVVKYINIPGFQSVRYPSLEYAWRAWDKSGGHEMAGLRHRRDLEWKLFCDI